MRRGEVWWAEFDERRPVVLLSGEDPSGFRAMQVVAPADTDISGLGIEVAVGVQEGLPFDGVLRFGFPWPGLTPCTWLTTLSREDLIERAGEVSAAKLSEIDDALHASQQRPEWTPLMAARLSEIKDSLRRRAQAGGQGTDARTSEGPSRPHDRLPVAPQQQDHDLRLEYLIRPRFNNSLLRPECPMGPVSALMRGPGHFSYVRRSCAYRRT